MQQRFVRRSSAMRSFICVLLLLATACRPDPQPTAAPTRATSTLPTSSEEPAPMDPYAPPWKLVVADGSANVYACEHTDATPARCSYRPITPEESSTGHYSGGDPWEVALTPAQIDALWREVAAAHDNTASHTEDRAKTTVAIEADGATKASFILDADAGVALMRVLTSLRPRDAAGPSI